MYFTSGRMVMYLQIHCREDDLPADPVLFMLGLLKAFLCFSVLMKVSVTVPRIDILQKKGEISSPHMSSVSLLLAPS